jgi:hypothetical protein
MFCAFRRTTEIMYLLQHIFLAWHSIASFTVFNKLVILGTSFAFTAFLANLAREIRSIVILVAIMEVRTQVATLLKLLEMKLLKLGAYVWHFPYPASKVVEFPTHISSIVSVGIAVEFETVDGS